MQYIDEDIQDEEIKQAINNNTDGNEENEEDYSINGIIHRNIDQNINQLEN